jgi:hypothetical protein
MAGDVAAPSQMEQPATVGGALLPLVRGEIEASGPAG